MFRIAGGDGVPVDGDSVMDDFSCVIDSGTPRLAVLQVHDSDFGVFFLVFHSGYRPRFHRGLQLDPGELRVVVSLNF